MKFRVFWYVALCSQVDNINLTTQLYIPGYSEIKITASRSSEWHHIPTKIHKMYQLVPKLIGWDRLTDTQRGW
jgi:hypothetical protein